jgi:hypothetical protein
MQENTKGTSEPTTAPASGLEPMEPWDIATLPISRRGSEVVDVEHATHEEFQAWIVLNRIPVKSGGIVGWSFDDRCAVINYARSKGVQLRFVESENRSENKSELDLFDSGKSASEAV